MASPSPNPSPNVALALTLTLAVTHGARQQCEIRMPSRRKRKDKHSPMVAVPGQGQG